MQVGLQAGWEQTRFTTTQFTTVPLCRRDPAVVNPPSFLLIVEHRSASAGQLSDDTTRTPKVLQVHSIKRLAQRSTRKESAATRSNQHDSPVRRT